MKRLILLIAVVATTNVVYSQADYRKGFIVTQGQDTLRGFVNYREGGRAFRSCDFKRSSEGEVVTYGPADIEGYGYDNDKVFQSREVTLRGQPPAVVFLEVIVDGLVSLYRVDETFLVEKDGGGLQQLINEETEVRVGSRMVARSSNEHIIVLNPMLFDCVETRQAVQDVKLVQKPLTKLIERYNRCIGGPTITYKNAKPWTRAHVSLVGSPTFSQVNFDPHPLYPQLKGDWTTSKAPQAGIALEFLSPRITERFSIYVSVLYSSPTFYSYEFKSEVGFTWRDYLTIELTQVKVPVGVRYTLQNRSFTPYINAGLTSTHHLESSGRWIHELEYLGVVETTDQEALKIKDTQVGFWGGVGVLKSLTNKITAFAEFRYEKTNGIAAKAFLMAPELRSNITNIQLVLGLTFW